MNNLEEDTSSIFNNSLEKLITGTNFYYEINGGGIVRIYEREAVSDKVLFILSAPVRLDCIGELSFC